MIAPPLGPPWLSTVVILKFDVFCKNRLGFVWLSIRLGELRWQGRP
jgi:hypothetical protein